MNTSAMRPKPTLRNALRSCRHIPIFFALIAIVPLILLYVFGFSTKTTPEHDCVLRSARSNAQVIAVTGEPLTPGLFAWTSYFEGSGRLLGEVAFTVSSWSALSDALMWPGAIEVVGVFLYHAIQVVPIEDEGVVKALRSDAANSVRR